MAKESEKFLQELESKGKKPNPHEAEDRELETALSNIWNIAREFKMDPFPTRFEVVPPHVMYEVGSYGLPVRASHWTHGRDYDQMKTSYDYGMSKIYEVVINADPSEAFLLENNAPIENKLVMAHVLGHTDFFKNNYLFKKTRKDMPEMAALSAKRIEGYEFAYGEKNVERVMDAAMAIEEHVDPFRPNRPPRNQELAEWRAEVIKNNQVTESKGEFDDLLPQKQQPKEMGVLFDLTKVTYPPTPDKDLLGIIRNHAPYLEEWERDVVDIVRSESVYFYPQMRTKIMNEGWASFWHKRIMREMADRKHITPAEDERVWEMHAGVVQPRERGIQPYYFGMKMFEYIEDRYNGNLDEKEKRWLEKEGYEVFPKYEGDYKDSPGLKKVREVMEENDDQSFVRNYFDKNIADRMNLFVYEERDYGTTIYQFVKDTGWMEIRDAIVASMDNCGNPSLVVTNIDHAQRNELKIKHLYEDRELEGPFVEKNLPYIHSLWRKPVHLDTVVDGKSVTYSYDGKVMKKTEGPVTTLRGAASPNPYYGKKTPFQRNYP